MTEKRFGIAALLFAIVTKRKSWMLFLLIVFMLANVAIAVWWEGDYISKVSANLSTTIVPSNRTLNTTFLLRINTSIIPNATMNWSDLRISDSNEIDSVPFQIIFENISGDTYIVVNTNTSNVTLYW